MSVRKERIAIVGRQRCPRRDEGLGFREQAPDADAWERGRWAATVEEADAEVAEFMASPGAGGIGNVRWLPEYGLPEQPRTCSFCGGVHPDDAVELIRAGWTVDGTDKAYKRYLEPPGYRDWMNRRGFLSTEPPATPSPVPPVKLYVQHFTEQQIAAFNEAIHAR